MRQSVAGRDPWRQAMTATAHQGRAVPRPVELPVDLSPRSTPMRSVLRIDASVKRLARTHSVQRRNGDELWRDETSPSTPMAAIWSICLRGRQRTGRPR